MNTIVVASLIGIVIVAVISITIYGAMGASKQLGKQERMTDDAEAAAKMAKREAEIRAKP
jgi:hypothetical protein